LQSLKRRALESLYAPRNVLSNRFVSAKLLPLGTEAGYAVLLRSTPSSLDGDLPTPPRKLWDRWGDTVEGYLDSGRIDVDSMLGILAEVGVRANSLSRVLDFGCAEGRMLRFFPRADDSELWGADVNAERISWAQQHLAPLRFVTTTTAPHLPFEDNYFDFIYCHSVFTHISDLADAWFLELRRILRPGGHIYLTIHDEHTVELLLGRYRNANTHVVDLVQRFERQTDVLSREWVYFSILADPAAQVFFNSEYLVEKWSHFAEFLSIKPEAAVYQTAVVFRKPPRS
jgi:ubiquinone/menaquinone biosynthesis C-methylase UbiE